MPNNQDSKAYRLQAKLWQDKADTLSGEARDVCSKIADGYAGLATRLEQHAVNGAHTGLTSGACQGQQSTRG